MKGNAILEELNEGPNVECQITTPLPPFALDSAIGKLWVVIRHNPDRPIIGVSIVSYSALGDATGEMSNV
jgi:hypothetical protein